MKLFAVTQRLLRSHLSNPRSLIIMLAFPLFFTLIFGGLLSGSKITNYPIALTLSTQTGATQEIETLLTQNPRLKITLCSESEARKLVHDRNVVAAIIIPEDLNVRLHQGEAVSYTLVREEENNLYLAVKQEVDQAFFEVHTAAVTARQIAGSTDSIQWDTVFQDTLTAWKNPNVTLDTLPLSRATKELSSKTTANVGFTIMFLMMSLVTTVGVMLQERVDGTWQRILATPIKRMEVLGGYLLGYFLMGWLQFGILACASHFLFQIDWGNPLGLIVLASAFILSSISLALALGGIVKTFQQQQAVATILVTASSMLAGVFWPLDLEPPFMQTLAHGIPQYWAMRGFNDLLLRGLNWSTLSLPLLVLSSFSIVFLMFGVWRIKFE